MKQVIHQNFLSTDNKVFCKKINKVTELDINKCNSCDMCIGSLQGMGVECLWDDEDKHYPILAVTDPVNEQIRVAKLTDTKKSIEIQLRK